MKICLGLVSFALLLTSIPPAFCASANGQAESWKQVVQRRLPLYGHRNWIVVADSAYPDQSAEGIETIVSETSQMDVLNYVLKALAGSRHVTPLIYTDAELKFLNERDAPGIAGYRDQLESVLRDQKPNVLPHEQIIAKLDAVSKTFHVLIIKTTMALPYTSVFLQLDCAYWPPDAEARLRASMAKQRAK